MSNSYIYYMCNNLVCYTVFTIISSVHFHLLISIFFDAKQEHRMQLYFISQKYSFLKKCYFSNNCTFVKISFSLCNFPFLKIVILNGFHGTENDALAITITGRFHRIRWVRNSDSILEDCQFFFLIHVALL